MLAINTEHMQTIRLIRFLDPHGHKSDQAHVGAAPRTSLAHGANGAGKGGWEGRAENPSSGCPDG